MINYIHIMDGLSNMRYPIETKMGIRMLKVSELFAGHVVDIKIMVTARRWVGVDFLHGILPSRIQRIPAHNAHGFYIERIH